MVTFAGTFLLISITCELSEGIPFVDNPGARQYIQVVGRAQVQSNAVQAGENHGRLLETDEALEESDLETRDLKDNEEEIGEKGGGKETDNNASANQDKKIGSRKKSMSCWGRLKSSGTRKKAGSESPGSVSPQKRQARSPERRKPKGIKFGHKQGRDPEDKDEMLQALGCCCIYCGVLATLTAVIAPLL